MVSAATALKREENSGLFKDVFFCFMVTLYVSVFIFANNLAGFNLILYIFCFAGATMFIVLRPVVGLYAIVFLTMIYERFFTLTSIVVNRAEYKFYPLDALLIITLLVVFFKKDASPWLSKDTTLKWFYSGLAIFFVVLLINFGRALIGGGDIEIAFSVVKNYIFYSVVYILTIQLITTPQRYRGLVMVMLLATIVILGIFLFGLVTGQTLFTQFIPLSTYGTRYLGGGHSYYVSIMIIVLLSWITFKQRIVQRWPMWIYWLILVVCCMALGLSLLRHLWLGVVLAIAFLLACYPLYAKARLLKILATLGLVGALSFGGMILVNKWQQAAGFATTDVLSSVVTRANSIIQLNFSDDSALWRKEGWKAAMRAWQKKPVFGLGFVSKIRVELFGYESEIQARDLHNDFVAILLQTGLVGVLAMLAWLFTLGQWFIQQARQASLATKQPLFENMAVVLVFLFSAGFGTYFDINLLVFFFWLFLGLLHNYTMINMHPSRSDNIDGDPSPGGSGSLKDSSSRDAQRGRVSRRANTTTL